jgi:hypothetical protein
MSTLVAIGSVRDRLKGKRAGWRCHRQKGETKKRRKGMKADEATRKQLNQKEVGNKNRVGRSVKSGGGERVTVEVGRLMSWLRGGRGVGGCCGAY